MDDAIVKEMEDTVVKDMEDSPHKQMEDNGQKEMDQSASTPDKKEVQVFNLFCKLVFIQD